MALIFIAERRSEFKVASAVEVWKGIDEYEGIYEVSNFGRVKHLETIDSCGKRHKERILRTQIDKRGYKKAHLSRDGTAEWKSVHRLVATAFCEKPEGCDIVNHLDNNPSNNNADNLEWTTYKGNMQHATRQGRMKYNPENLFRAQESNKKPVVAIRGNERIKFNSQAEAAKVLGVCRGHIAAACRKEYGYKTVGGFEWEYQDQEYQNNLKPNKVKMTDEERKEFQRSQMLGNKIMLGRKLSEETKEKLRKQNGKPVSQYDLTGNFVAEYFSVKEAKRATGISHIDACCRGERKTAGGYAWRYKNE